MSNLGQFQEAIKAAKKAESTKTWEEVNLACVKAKEFQLAATAGLKIIVHPDRLEFLIILMKSMGSGKNLLSSLIQDWH